jgi:hypothetical protein
VLALLLLLLLLLLLEGQAQGLRRLVRVRLPPQRRHWLVLLM